MGNRHDLGPDEFAGLAQEVLLRLARDPAARHLWHFRSRPNCADEPPGRSRRNHLATLLGVLGAAALPGMVGCDNRSSGDDSGRDSAPPPDVGAEPFCSEDPYNPPHDMLMDRSPDGNRDLQPPDAPRPEIGVCGDDPCACADDPCGCGDDPCSCGDDPCACGDDPCACADDPC